MTQYEEILELCPELSGTLIDRLLGNTRTEAGLPRLNYIKPALDAACHHDLSAGDALAFVVLALDDRLQAIHEQMYKLAVTDAKKPTAILPSPSNA